VPAGQRAVVAGIAVGINAAVPVINPVAQAIVGRDDPCGLHVPMGVGRRAFEAGRAERPHPSIGGELPVPLAGRGQGDADDRRTVGSGVHLSVVRGAGQGPDGPARGDLVVRSRILIRRGRGGRRRRPLFGHGVRAGKGTMLLGRRLRLGPHGVHFDGGGAKPRGRSRLLGRGMQLARGAVQLPTRRMRRRRWRLPLDGRRACRRAPTHDEHHGPADAERSAQLADEVGWRCNTGVGHRYRSSATRDVPHSPNSPYNGGYLLIRPFRKSEAGLCVASPSVSIPEVLELQRYAEVRFAQKGNHGLQVVTLLACHPDLVALGLGRDTLGSLVLDEAVDGPGVV
jgi:hypothetical protein